MHAILQDVPLPARLAPWPKASLTTLTRCVLLAALLHLWLVLWLGSAPGGTAPLGQGVFGAINISLRGPVTAGAAAVVVPPAPDNTRPGDAAVPRWGGAVRSVEPPADSEPGSARLGQRTSLPPVSPPAPVVPLPLTSAPVMPSAAVPAVPEPLQAQPTPQPAPSEPSPVRVLKEMPAAQVPDPAREPLTASSPPLPAAAALPAVPAPNAVIAAAQLERQLASPLSQSAAAPAVAPLPSLTPAAALPELAALPPAAQASALLRHLQAAPAAARAPAPALSRSEDLATAVLPAPAALPSVGVAAARVGADDAGAQVGRDVATPPAAAASAAPRLNLERVRPRGGELSRYSTRGVLPVLPRPPERDEKLAREIEKAGKADCRNAYGGMGPLAVIPLALDALRKDGGCKW